MDPAIELAPTPGPRVTLPRALGALGWLFAGTVVALGAVDATIRTTRGELIWPVPPDVWGGVVFVTALLVIWGGIRIATRRADPLAVSRDTPGRRIDALVAGPILLLIAISSAARVAVQIVGFAGLHPVAVAVPFTVIDTRHRQSRGGTDYYQLRLRYGAEGRTFTDPVRRSVYEAAQEGDTVALPVETGRFGLQRAMVGAPLLPADLHHPH